MVNYYLNKKMDAMQLSELRKFVGWNTMESSLNNPKLQCFLSVSAYEGDRLVGYVEVVSNGVTDAYIQDLMVYPEMQNQGFGTQMMSMVIKEIRERNIYMLSVIYGEEKLKEDYERFGFFSMLCGQMQLRDEE